MQIQKIEEKYADFLKDTLLQQYEMLADNPNIFEILKTQTYEIRHSNFLAWLLDPNQNHGLGNKFLKLFLYDLAIDEKSTGLSIIDLHRLDFTGIKIYREWNNIDLLLVFDNLIIAVENKIRHIESNGQLERYFTKVRREFGSKLVVPVFLTPNGDEASHENYINYSYEQLINYIEQILELNRSMISRTRIYLEDYLWNLKNNIMGNGRKNDLANKIYYQHKELFDFIINNKTSDLQEIKAKLATLIHEKGWVIGSGKKVFLRFLPSKLDAVIPKGVTKGWQHGEAFLFEIHFKESTNEITAFCTIGNFEGPLHKKLIDALQKIKKYNPDSKGWITYLSKKFHYKDYEYDQEKIVDDVEQYLEKMVEKVETLLLLEEFTQEKLKIEN